MDCAYKYFLYPDVVNYEENAWKMFYLKWAM